MRVPATVVFAGLVLFASAALAAKPQPWKPAKPAPQSAAPAPASKEHPLWHGKPVNYVDGVPDTGQFLPDTAVLGRVNDKLFRVRDFREGWFSSYAEYRPKPDSAGRAEFLSSMANKEVLALTARSVGRPLDFTDRAQLRDHRERVLSNVAFQRIVADSTKISEDDIRRAYEQRKSALRLQHIQMTDRALAERVRQDLMAKRITWSAAVKKYSQARNDRGPDGELGWMIRQALDPFMAADVYALGPGEVSHVYQDPSGFEIMRVVERRPAAVAPLETVRKQIVIELQPVMMAAGAERMRTLLRARAGLTYDTTNVVWASQQMGETAPVRTDAEGHTTVDVTGSIHEFSDADTGRVLARWNEGTLTLGGFLGQFKALAVPMRPNVNSFDAMRNAIDGFILESYTAALAEERGYDKDPLAVAAMEKKREELMVEHLFADSIESRVYVSQADRKAYYQKHLPEFFSFQSVRYAAILRPNRAAAESLQAALQHGARAEDILRADSLAGKNTGAIQVRREDERGEYYKLLFEEMKPGDVVLTAPDREGMIAVIQLLEHDPGRQLRLDEVESIVDESLQNIKSEALLKAFIARHGRAYSIELHPELVTRIRLVDPLLD